MIYFIIFLLIIIIVIMYFYYERKLGIIKKQLRITSTQYQNIRSSLLKNKNLNIKFLTPSTSTAITNKKAKVLLAPLPSAPIVNSLNIKMEVSLLDCALINNSTWFYVSLPVDDNNNCRGWINKKDIALMCSTSQDIIITR